MSPPTTAAGLLSALQALHLLGPREAAELAREHAETDGDVRELARRLVQRGWLTAYQANEIILGRGEPLLLGAYVLCDKLGEGGMGAVYRARNWRLDKVVALKLIRKERLANDGAVRRFHREIRAAAQLSHPNIVRAFDADEVDGTHFLVMEYVEGTDLHQLVRGHGPLTVAAACDYVGQAALGLQHAHERGMVHRDIKPHNLLLTGAAFPEGGGPPAGGTVKVLDLGLARIEAGEDDGQSSTMTHSGVVMGTADYMAPEQSLDSRDVDTRADLYSLGCTLFFLLAGRTPFAGGTFTEKLMKHQLRPPPDVRAVRPDTPEAVAAVVARLLEKDRARRFQTPAELAEALAALGHDLPAHRAAAPESPAETCVPDPTSVSEAPASAWRDLTPTPVQPPPRPRGVSGRWVGVAVGAAAVLAALGGLWWATRPGDAKKDDDVTIVRPRVKPAPPDPGPVPPAPADVLTRPGPANDAWVQAIAALDAEAQAKHVLAKLKELNPGFDDKHPSNRAEFSGNRVIALHLSQPITDISPVRALPKLELLFAVGTATPNYAPAPAVSLADLRPLRGLPLRVLRLGANRVRDLGPLADMPLDELHLTHTEVEDLTPLAKCPLRTLHLNGTPVADLGPLKGMKQLIFLNATNTRVRDLTPLAGLKLQTLLLSNTAVRDLGPLRGMPLTSLWLDGTKVEDLAPLEGMSLAGLRLAGAPIQSLAPLTNLAGLQSLGGQFEPGRDEPLLSRVKGLTTINGQPAQAFWKLSRPASEHDAFVNKTAGLAAAQQVEAVMQELARRNGFAPRPKFQEEAGRVVSLVLDPPAAPADARPGTLDDISPLAALKYLRHLEIRTGGHLRHLWPLRDLPIEKLVLTSADDLRPLAKLPLRHLTLSTDVSLGLPLASLARAPLEELAIDGYGLALDVAPLRGLPLKSVNFYGFVPHNAEALAELPLERYANPGPSAAEVRLLRALPSLESINGKDPAVFWKTVGKHEVEFIERELTRLNPGLRRFETKLDKGAIVEADIFGDPFADLTPVAYLRDVRTLVIRGGDDRGSPMPLPPLRGLPITTLNISSCAPESLAALEGLRLDHLTLGYGRMPLGSLRGVTARTLSMWSTPVQDLTPLKNLGLETLDLNFTAVKDLSPLRGAGLRTLRVRNSSLDDLTPIADMPLETLFLERSGAIKDLGPLQTIKTLKRLALDSPWSLDCSPLSGLPIECLILGRTDLTDWTALRKLPLKQLNLQFQPFRGDADLLRSLPGLQFINDKKAVEFLKEADAEQAAFDQWCADVAKLPAMEQVKAVLDELLKRNPGLQARDCTFSADTQVDIASDKLSDLAPLRALPALRVLWLRDATKLTQLWALRGLKLQSLILQRVPVTDLSPLRDAPYLTRLTVGDSPGFSDLSPLRGMKRLEAVELGGTGVSDLAPISGLPLHALNIQATKVTDLSPLRLMPLKALWLSFVPWRDSRLLRSIKTLEKVYDRPAREFFGWADWEDAVRAGPPAKQIEMVQAKLAELNGKGAALPKLEWGTGKDPGAIAWLKLAGGVITDLAPVRALPALESLTVYDSKGLTDVTPLQGLELKEVFLMRTGVKDLAPLAGMPLAKLNLTYTPVADLRPLRGMPLTSLILYGTPVADLAPLAGVPLRDLDCRRTAVTSLAPLRETPLERLECGQSEVLKSLAGLEKLPLRHLNLSLSAVTSLEPVRDCPLESLSFGGDRGVHDLAPLRGMKTLRVLVNTSNDCRDLRPLAGLALEEVHLALPAVNDLAPLRGMPIRKLTLNFNRWRDEDVLRSLTGLKEISPCGDLAAKFVPAETFWKGVEAEQAEFDAWVAQVRGKATAGAQVALVERRLIERNKDYVGPIQFEADQDGIVRKLVLKATRLDDISPVRALPGLKELICSAGPDRPTPVADLWPLRGLPLVSLDVAVVPQRDAPVLRQMATLRTVNGKPASDVRD